MWLTGDRERHENRLRPLRKLAGSCIASVPKPLPDRRRGPPYILVSSSGGCLRGPSDAAGAFRPLRGERHMDFEKFTERARGFVQSAQSLALREGHQQFTPEHLLKVLLDDPEGLAGGLIDRCRRPLARGAGGGRGGARQDAEGLGRRRRASFIWRPRSRGCSTRPQKIAEKAGDSYVTVERLLLALALEKDSDAGKILAKGRRDAAEPQRGDRSAAQGPHRRYRDRRERLRRAEEICPRSDPGRARRQARSGHRPRRGNPPHHPGAVAPHQEQSGADRRARRRQDRDRRRPGAAHRQWRRAGEPARTRSCWRSTWAR